MQADFYIPLMILTGLGLFFGIVLSVAYRKFKVFEDPRIDTVEEMLPSANCGACGEPGCRAFAEKVVGSGYNPAKCTVSTKEGLERIASYLGVEVKEEEKIVARVRCAGGIKEAHNLASYKGGMSTCRGEAVVAGGSKDCTWGCLGLGDCATVCDFDAIHMSSNGLPVVDIDKCTACGDCVEVCPKSLFSLMPVSQKLIVQCKSLLDGDLAEAKCSVACTGCARCVADAAPDLISIEQHLAVIDYSMNDLSGPSATKRCPTGAIVWLEDDRQFSGKTYSNLPLGNVEEYINDEIYYQ